MTYVVPVTVKRLLENSLPEKGTLTYANLLDRASEMYKRVVQDYYDEVGHDAFMSDVLETIFEPDGSWKSYRWVRGREPCL